MYPRIGPVPTYSIFYILSIVSHFLVCYFIAKRLGLRRRVWIVTGICYVVGMTVGAKILFDIQNAQFDLRALLSIRHYMRGGMWGGLLAYFILALPLVLILAKNRRAALDLVAISIPVPWIFAKIGCLFNGCCYGKASSLPWAITFPEGARGAPAGVSLHPTQIYEILVVVCILIVFKKLKYEKSLRNGTCSYGIFQGRLRPPLIRRSPHFISAYLPACRRRFNNPPFPLATLCSQRHTGRVNDFMINYRH
jgi:phosphatidylglycerol:prolipoprotein diacylglycerol transferase